jgi:hypothetical protein
MFIITLIYEKPNKIYYLSKLYRFKFKGDEWRKLSNLLDSLGLSFISFMIESDVLTFFINSLASY